MTPKEKAKQIAEFLFTAGSGEKAVRLVLHDAERRDMGGWSERSMAGWIEKFLSEPKSRQRGEGEEEKDGTG